MGEIRLGPIEWGVVTAHHLWGMGVRLEESGDEWVMVLSSIHDDFLRCNGEYWPEIGERIRVRRYIYNKGIASNQSGERHGGPGARVRPAAPVPAPGGVRTGPGGDGRRPLRLGRGGAPGLRAGGAIAGGSWRAGPIPLQRSAGPESVSGSASGPWASGPTAACD